MSSTTSDIPSHEEGENHTSPRPHEMSNLTDDAHYNEREREDEAAPVSGTLSSSDSHLKRKTCIQCVK